MNCCNAPHILADGFYVSNFFSFAFFRFILKAVFEHIKKYICGVKFITFKTFVVQKKGSFFMRVDSLPYT